MIVVGQVDAAGSDKSGFQHRSGSKFVLEVQVVLTDQRRMDDFIQETWLRPEFAPVVKFAQRCPKVP